MSDIQPLELEESEKQTETDDYGNDSEAVSLKERPPAEKFKLSAALKIRTYLDKLNWKNIAASLCLWISAMICSAAYSLMGPFFPQEVVTINDMLAVCPIAPTSCRVSVN